MIIALYLLTTFGAAYLIKETKITEPIRFWLQKLPGIWGAIFTEHFSCYFCVGFASSSLVSLVLYTTSEFDKITALFFLFGGAAFCLVLGTLLDTLNKVLENIVERN